MKQSIALICRVAPVAALGLLANVTSAQTTWTKADNTTALTTSGSWTVSGVPSTGDSLLFDNTLTADRTASIGTGLNVLGIRQTNTTSGRTFTVDSSGANTLSIGTGGVAITTGARLTFAAPVVLTGNQSWTMATGRVNVNNTLTTGGNTLSISAANAGSGLLSFTGNNTLGSEVTVGTMDRIYVQSGTVTFNGTNNTNSGFQIFGGTANIVSMGNLTGASSIGKGSAYIRGGSTLNYTGNTATSDKGFTRDTSNSNSTFNVTTSGQTLSMSGNLTSTGVSGGWILGGPGNLSLSGVINNATNTTVTKQGGGTLTLSGSNNYTGTTTVSAGTLIVDGNQSSATGNVTVASGATLGGGGTIGGNTTIASGAALTGGTSGMVDTLNFANGLTASSGSIWLVDLVQATSMMSDQINVTAGNFNISGATLQLNFLDAPAVPGNTYHIATYSGLGSAFTSTFNGLAEGDVISGYQIHYGGGTTGFISLTAVPEPGTLGLLGLAISGFFFRRIRRLRPE